MDETKTPSPARPSRPVISTADAGARPCVDGASVVTATSAGDAVVVCRGARTEVHVLGGSGSDGGAAASPPTLVDAGPGPPPRAAALSPDRALAALLRGASVQVVATAAGCPTVAVLAPAPGSGADTLGVAWAGGRVLTLIARDGAHTFCVDGAAGVGATAAASRRGRAPAPRTAWYAATSDGATLLLGGADGWVTPARVDAATGAAARGALFAPPELAAGGPPAGAALLQLPAGDVYAVLAPARPGGAAGVYVLPKAASGGAVRAGGLPGPPGGVSPAPVHPPLFTVLGGLLVRLDPGHGDAVVADAPGGASRGLRSARVPVGGLPAAWTEAASGGDDADDDAAADPPADTDTPTIRARRRSSGPAPSPRPTPPPPRFTLTSATLLDTRTGRAYTLHLDVRAAADALAGRAPSGGRVAFFVAHARGRAGGALAAAAWRALLRAPGPVGDELAVAAAALAGGGPGAPPAADILSSLGEAGVAPARAAAAAAAFGAALAARGAPVPPEIQSVVVGVWPTVVVGL